ncbi:HIT family protein [Tenacibaculum finnmarkense genomovar finnmarkense]|uniref:HIT domain-containing protein n=1 Tax=Tenacibaculum finnmarkense genomovar finnmarkense TaxID=1458503 RepID=A0AAP1WH12_9FLAO|nr:HIT family protein [Tenacibaculum finnmarkense]MBE7653661.1 HIT domain-containing protein [Tenacibaculum finnmarkense genomovar finnmarkense]MBE7695947.1 HIT domain-containing protein [Tenacibaculum finnmarkense genomovar finnmarkense]MCD8418537.1 HIT family protein [Tenacibaculum finnmarkense genomovar finnmarkense]MCD8428160.1 HIT family protein [Tenacibaculum finnmarkense genomovar finnmarkense]MCD8438833.1 HIT family protein [Tenacibaculum finnmarkense genomovar ulcerans]
MEDCIFCKIIRGEEKSHVIWEDDKHIAFLSIFPNTLGFTVVATKKHKASYCFELSDADLADLMLASKKVGLLIDSKLEDVGRTGLMMEGFGVNHAHTKLFPMHGTADMSEWKAINSNKTKYFDKYEGYLSSHDSEIANEDELKKTAEKIRN